MDTGQRVECQMRKPKNQMNVKAQMTKMKKGLTVSRADQLTVKKKSEVR